LTELVKAGGGRKAEGERATGSYSDGYQLVQTSTSSLSLVIIPSTQSVFNCLFTATAMHSPDPNHPDEAIARIVNTDPVLRDLQKTIAGFSSGKASHPTFIARDADELALEGKNLPELKKLFGNYILEGAAVLFPSERGWEKRSSSCRYAWP
jgi:hypothetical protein